MRLWPSDVRCVSDSPRAVSIFHEAPPHTAAEPPTIFTSESGKAKPDAKVPDRPTLFEDFDNSTEELIGNAEIPLAIRYFGDAGLAHMEKYGTKLETFAEIRAKVSRHAVNNPLAIFRKELSAEEVRASPLIMHPVVHRLMA